MVNLDFAWTITSGYHQENVEESHKCRTAFKVGPLGFFECNKMPFGLSSSPASVLNGNVSWRPEYVSFIWTTL